MFEHLVIGSRGSRLALWQANAIAGQLRVAHPRLRVEVTIIKTSGDQQADASLTEWGGIGVFVKEIEQALLDRVIDIAVHSMKDVPTTLPPGLFMGAVLHRADGRDALVSKGGGRLADLPRGAKIATGSLRRQAQLRHYRPDLRFVPIRGNVDTRLHKLQEQDLDGLILAAAGLDRLGLSSRISERIDGRICLPAVGQGALGVEMRVGDERVARRVAPLNHTPTARAVAAERALLRHLGGGCLVPLGAWGRVTDGQLVLEGTLVSPDGQQVVREKRVGHPEEAEIIGRALAEYLLAQGGEAILAALQDGSG